VESSCEFGIEPSGSIKYRETFRVSKELGIFRLVLSSMALVSYCDDSDNNAS
jgi:hypothetical protein